MSENSLSKERNYFLAGFFALVGSAIVIRIWATQASGYEIRLHADALILAQLAAKGLFIYLVFRLSRFLGHPAWLTVVYCIFTPFSLLYLVPFVGLLIGVANARSRLRSRSITALGSALPEKPAMPRANDTLGVVTWFLHHDDKISDFRNRFPTALTTLCDELVREIDSIDSAHQLQEHLVQLSAQYSTVLARAALETASGERPADGGYAESATAARMRILGYILLRRYGIQPEP